MVKRYKYFYGHQKYIYENSVIHLKARGKNGSNFIFFNYRPKNSNKI